MRATRLLSLLCCLMLVFAANGQGLMGMSGLINTPSADMYDAGDVMIGGNFLNKNYLDRKGLDGFTFEGKPYHTGNFYASITPFWWIELGYTMTLFKTIDEGYTSPKYNRKDRALSVKLAPLREGKYYPAVAIGSNDFLGSGSKKHGTGPGLKDGGYFTNFYIVATKHFRPRGQDIAVNLAYRYCPGDYTKNWNGLVGGVAWRPKWVPQLRVIAEYCGHDINIGADVLLWKHLFLQASLLNGQYFSGGAAVKFNLF